MAPAAACPRIRKIHAAHCAHTSSPSGCFPPPPACLNPFLSPPLRIGALALEIELGFRISEARAGDVARRRRQLNSDADRPLPSRTWTSMVIFIFGCRPPTHSTHSYSNFKFRAYDDDRRRTQPPGPVVNRPALTMTATLAPRMATAAIAIDRYRRRRSSDACVPPAPHAPASLEITMIMRG